MNTIPISVSSSKHNLFIIYTPINVTNYQYYCTNYYKLNGRQESNHNPR